MKITVYEQVTNRMIELLEQGVVPWKSPYLATVGFPKNFATGNGYRGINIFLLGSLRYTSPYFLTFFQAKELGGFVKKGERGGMVIKYGTFTKETEGAPAQDATEEERRYLKAYTVFNASQIEGIAFPKSEPLPEFSPSQQCDRAREIIAAMPQQPAIKEGMAIPCYRPSTDSVHMPERGYFDQEEGYYSTLFHELAHATGHQSRLARKSLIENKGIDATGEDRKVYAEEELVAEMSASFLNAHAGTQNLPSYFAVFSGANSRSEVEAFVGNLQTKIFHANGDPTTNNWAADSIGRTRQMQYYGGMSEAIARASGPGINQSAGGSQVFEYLVQPQEFTMLKTGGPECEMQVDCIIFQGGRRWIVPGKDRPKTQNFMRHTFAQVYEGQAG